jgi:methionine synthase II (cobalamin-independent)
MTVVNTVLKTTFIEDLVELNTDFIEYLADRHIKCIKCGEPIWGTLEEAAVEKGYTSEQIDVIIHEMNQILLKEKTLNDFKINTH